ncbi:MAG: TerC family protein [Bacteroidota bacterium]|nr:TerC family protein [Bacteroidota bacterium]
MIDIIIALITLILLEVILGIDNIIFISILSDKLPEEQRPKIRKLGIFLAMIIRLGLLAVVAWIMKLDQGLFTVLENEISGKDLILIIGGLFLMYKSTVEIYHKTEADIDKENETKSSKPVKFNDLLIQILLLDIVFSIDSIITAVGLVKELWMMYTAVIVSVAIMYFAAKPISNFISKHPSFKILALCFLMMIGLALMAEGLDFEIPKGYIYFSMFFSFIVQVIQMKTVDKKIVKH